LPFPPEADRRGRRDRERCLHLPLLLEGPHELRKRWETIAKNRINRKMNWSRHAVQYWDAIQAAISAVAPLCVHGHHLRPLRRATVGNGFRWRSSGVAYGLCADLRLLVALPGDLRVAGNVYSRS